MESLNVLIQGMGLMYFGVGQVVMLLVSLLLFWLVIVKKFELLLLLLIGFGGLFFNILEVGLVFIVLESLLVYYDLVQLVVIVVKFYCVLDVYVIKVVLVLVLLLVQGQMESFVVDMGYFVGVLVIFYKVVIGLGIVLLVIFMGVGVMIDFGLLLVNLCILLLGVVVQFGIFVIVFGVLMLNYFGIISFILLQVVVIGIIGGVDGLMVIYLLGKLVLELLGVIVVVVYFYMVLVLLIQLLIMKVLIMDKEWKICMVQLCMVSKWEKIFFLVVLLLLVVFLLLDVVLLLGMFCFGNLMCESGVVEWLSDMVQNVLINIVIIFFGLLVGVKLVVDKFLQLQMLGILVLGVIVFCVGIVVGVLMVKLMNVFSWYKINLLIGLVGVLVVLMVVWVLNKVGLEVDGQNFLLMYVMGLNVVGVIGLVIVVGVMFKYVLVMQVDIFFGGVVVVLFLG